MTQDPLSLTLRRHFDAPAEVVFDAWTDPDSPVGWWGPAGFTLVSNESDPRPGGRYRLAMRSPAGEVMVNGGIYREVVRPTRLVMTHGWEGADGASTGPETVITLTFTPRDGGTDMQFEQTGFDTVAGRDGHGGGWNEAFDALAEALARLGG